MDSPNHPSRRQFLTGRAALDSLRKAATDAALGGAEAAASPLAEFDRAEAPYVVRYTRTAMASDFQLSLVAGYPDDAAEAALEALDLLEPLEAQLTVYRPTSEVLEINRHAADGPVVVEPRLFELLERACRWYGETEGAFDMTSGPLTKAWGFARRQGSVPTPHALGEALERVGGERVVLDEVARTVRFTDPGTEINLNSCGKGYALDRAAELLLERGVEHFLWHGGQSSVVAHGSAQPGRDPAAGWAIGIGHPLRPGERLAELLLRNRAAGTSGASFQFFRHEGKRYGHILDPRTGRPAEGVFSVTVLAPTGAEADALSTAFYVLGYDKAAEYCRKRPEIAFLMLMPSPQGGAIELATAGLADDEWRLVADRPA